MPKIMRPFLSDCDSPSCIQDIIIQQLVPSTKCNLTEGEILWHENEYHPYTYFVKKGMVKLHLITREGREKSLFYYTTGAWFGFQGLNEGKMTITTATAILPTTLYKVEFALLYAYIKNHPEYLSALTNYVFHHMVLEAQEIVNISLYNTAERLNVLLVHLAEEYQEEGQNRVLIPLSNEEIGNMVGASRNSVSSAISALREQKLVRKQRGGLIITDLKRLKEYNM